MFLVLIGLIVLAGAGMFFSLTGFTTYAQGINANLSIWDEADSGMPHGDQVRLMGDNTYFFANYTNSTNGENITGQCNITFDDAVNAAMFWNSTELLYEYNRSFSSEGYFGYTINCSVAGYDYDNLTATDSIFIGNDTDGDGDPQTTDCDDTNASLFSPSDGVAITSPGSYRLCPGSYNSIDRLNNGIILINSSNVVLDCNNVNITGNGSGIAIGLIGQLNYTSMNNSGIPITGDFMTDLQAVIEYFFNSYTGLLSGMNLTSINEAVNNQTFIDLVIDSFLYLVIPLDNNTIKNCNVQNYSIGIMDVISINSSLNNNNLSKSQSGITSISLGVDISNNTLSDIRNGTDLFAGTAALSLISFRSDIHNNTITNSDAGVAVLGMVMEFSGNYFSNNNVSFLPLFLLLNAELKDNLFFNNTIGFRSGTGIALNNNLTSNIFSDNLYGAYLADHPGFFIALPAALNRIRMNVFGNNTWDLMINDSTHGGWIPDNDPPTAGAGFEVINNSIYLNHFYGGGINCSSSNISECYNLNNFCYGGEGNFYRPYMVVPPGDCGQVTITKPSAGENMPAGVLYNFTWTRQSSISDVTYDLFAINESNGEEFAYLGSTEDLNMSVNTTGAPYGNYSLLIVPWVESGTINGTNASVSFEISCDIPGEWMNLTKSTNLCAGTYFRSNSPAGGDAIINAGADNIIIRCLGTRLVSNGNFSAFMIKGHNNVTITGCTAEGYSYGFFVLEGENNSIINNTVLNLRNDSNIMLPVGINDVSSTGSTIIGNRIYGNLALCKICLGIYSGPIWNARENVGAVIQDNFIRNLQGGIVLSTVLGGGSSRAIISGNDISAEVAGIIIGALSDTANDFVYNNTIRNNKITSKGKAAEIGGLSAYGAGMGFTHNALSNEIYNNTLLESSSVSDVFVTNSSAASNDFWSNDFSGKGVSDAWKNNNYCVNDTGNTYRTWGTKGWNDCGRVIGGTAEEKKPSTTGGPAFYENKIYDVTGDSQVIDLTTTSPVDFNLGGTPHSLMLLRLYIDHADFSAQSNRVDFTLYIGDEKELDLDGDGANDLYIKLRDIISNRASVILKRAEPTPPTVKPAEQTKEETEPAEVPPKEEAPAEMVKGVEKPSMILNYQTLIYAVSFIIFITMLIVSLVMAYRKHYLTYVLEPIEKAEHRIEKAIIPKRAAPAKKKNQGFSEREEGEGKEIEAKLVQVEKRYREVRAKKAADMHEAKESAPAEEELKIIAPEIRPKKAQPSAIEKVSSILFTPETHMQKQLKVLEENVKKLSGEDLTDKEIVEELKKAGWKQEHIELVLYEAHKPGNQIYNLYKYAQRQEQRGRSKAEIRETLETAGWPSHIIDLILEFKE